MMKLTTFAPAFGEIAASPFSIKALCLMEMSGLPYERVNSMDPRSAPKQKLPILEDGGVTIPDSDFIRDHLEAVYNLDFDEGLSVQDRAVSRAMISMAEDGLYFGLVANRWQEENHWPTTREELFSDIPAILRKFVTNKIRKGAVAMLNGQGMGRFTQEERVRRVKKYCDAFAGQLGDKRFLFGDRPTAADASVIALLCECAAFPVKNPTSDVVLNNPNLMAYIARGKVEMFPA